ncbi:MAG TPA: VOC family protein [Gemmataceae bacterium]|nr:VOC family protein [Gemmataceae bacterium]
MIALSLIVLCCTDLERSRAFYTALGLHFGEERHDNGPVHYSCQLGTVVIELYPGKPGSALARTSAGATLHGFRVDSLDAIVSSLQVQGTEIVHLPSDSPWGRRAVILDPDGRAIELTQIP